MTDRNDMDRGTPPPPNEGTPRDATSRDLTDRDVSGRDAATSEPERRSDDTPAPGLNDDSAMDAIQRRLKFGSAGSGGAELDPGVPRQD